MVSLGVPWPPKTEAPAYQSSSMREEGPERLSVQVSPALSFVEEAPLANPALVCLLVTVFQLRCPYGSPPITGIQGKEDELGKAKPLTGPRGEALGVGLSGVKLNVGMDHRNGTSSSRRKP
jgi:hypothetical protein